MKASVTKIDFTSILNVQMMQIFITSEIKNGSLQMRGKFRHKMRLFKRRMNLKKEGSLKMCLNLICSYLSRRIKKLLSRIRTRRRNRLCRYWKKKGW
jgi:hypothetical protein